MLSLLAISGLSSTCKELGWKERGRGIRGSGKMREKRGRTVMEARRKQKKDGEKERKRGRRRGSVKRERLYREKQQQKTRLRLLSPKLARVKTCSVCRNEIIPNITCLNSSKEIQSSLFRSASFMVLLTMRLICSLGMCNPTILDKTYIHVQTKHVRLAEPTPTHCMACTYLLFI